MSVVYTAISAVLLFWHSAWDRLLGDPNWPWVLGIVFLVLTVRVALLPVAVRQIRAQRAMRALQPQVDALRSKHRTEPEVLQRELLALYRTAKVNPLASLLPLLLQAPIFLALLHVLRHLRPSVTGEAARTLYGWTAAQFDAAAHATLFGAPLSATFPDAPVVAAALIAVMIVTSFLTTRRTLGRDAEAVHRLMRYAVPASVLISGAVLPVGVMIYWVTQNVFLLAQQWWLLRPAVRPGSAAAAAGP